MRYKNKPEADFRLIFFLFKIWGQNANNKKMKSIFNEFEYLLMLLSDWHFFDSFLYLFKNGYY